MKNHSTVLTLTGKYCELYTFVDKHTSHLPKRPSNPNTAYILSAFLSPGGNLDNLDKTWSYWSGADYIVENIPSHLKLERVSFHKICPDPPFPDDHASLNKIALAFSSGTSFGKEKLPLSKMKSANDAVKKSSEEVCHASSQNLENFTNWPPNHKSSPKRQIILPPSTLATTTAPTKQLIIEAPSHKSSSHLKFAATSHAIAKSLSLSRQMEQSYHSTDNTKHVFSYVLLCELGEALSDLNRAREFIDHLKFRQCGISSLYVIDHFF